jgi:hypothetical protein
LFVCNDVLGVCFLIFFHLDFIFFLVSTPLVYPIIYPISPLPRSSDGKNLSTVYQQFQELRRRIRQREQKAEQVRVRCNLCDVIVVVHFDVDKMMIF